MMSRSQKLRPTVRERLFGTRARTFALWAFVVLVFLTGGASRHDVFSLLLLRPLAFVAIAFALMSSQPGQFRAMPLPFYLLLALAALIVLQLVPLPWDVWHGLPGHGSAAALARDAGIAGTARPLSLVPSRTSNALFSLGVPLAAFLLYRVAPMRARRQIAPALVIGGAVSVMVGLLQDVSGPASALYTYRVHSEGEAVGLFANRNHQGVFLACVIVFAGVYAARLRPSDRGTYFKLVLLAGLVAALVPFILVLGSRAGLLLGIAALATVPFVLMRAPWVTQLLAPRRGHKPGRAKERAAPSRRISPRLLLFGAFALAITGLGALALNNARDESFSRLSDSGAASPFDRAEVVGYLWRMLHDYLPWGSGFGSFDTVFHIYEPRDAISTVYLNQAHNDWLQFVIEGGAPAALLLLAFVGWAALKVVAAWRKRHSQQAPVRLAMLAILAIVALASVVDYPLRTPIMMMVLAFVVSLLSDDEVALPPVQARGGST
jgi:O-antigen ligase